ncbi:type II secretion system F family protein [Candidatus Microgenomates bacterium]|nr:type II secretion system F family protein [Candidatus Microgenomates bacterium]
MPNYQFTARTQANQLQSGTIVASDRAAAIKTLTQRRLTPVLLKEAVAKKGLKLNLTSGVSAKNMVIFTRQLATMINAGVPIVQSLRTLQEQTDSPNLKRALTAIVAKVEGGAALSEALAEHPKVFSPVYINMVKAGETGGILDQVLEKLAFQVEKDQDIKAKAIGALIYPSIITLITFGAFLFLMTTIVPKLKSIFDQFQSQLPVHTRVMLGISNTIIKYGWLIFLLAIVLLILFIRIIRTPTGKKRWHRLLLKVPIFGKIILKVNVARFARTFSSLTSAGVTVLDGLNVTSKALKNVIIKQGIIQAAEKVKNGQPISTALEEVQVFPLMVGRMAAVGEETGQVDLVLAKVADFYEKEVDRTIAALTSIIEPLLIIFLGGIVGLIVGSVFGPISNLSNIVK